MQAWFHLLTLLTLESLALDWIAKADVGNVGISLLSIKIRLNDYALGRHSTWLLDVLVPRSLIAAHGSEAVLDRWERY